MTKRINISIPDDLAATLEEIKGQINVSEVCRVGLEQQARIAKLRKEGDDMSATIERLRAERSKYFADYRAQGEEQGYKDAGGMPYPVLVALAAEAGMLAGRRGYVPHEFDDSGADDWKSEAQQEADVPDGAWDEYWEGYCCGVETFFDKVEDQL